MSKHLRKFVKFFAPKRKQCCKCYKTFYQVEWVDIDIDVSPCCLDDYIIV
jgi:hypothetical protein